MDTWHLSSDWDKSGSLNYSFECVIKKKESNMPTVRKIIDCSAFVKRMEHYICSGPLKQMRHNERQMMIETVSGFLGGLDTLS